MSTTTRTMTAEELLRLPRGKACYELVKGELITMSPAGQKHGRIIMNLGVPLTQHVKTNKLGYVYGAETGFKLAADPDTVRAPDIAFVSQEQVDKVGDPEGYWPGAPDLAVEVLSPGDRVSEVEQKVQEYPQAGTRLVWVVSPKMRTVTVYRSLTDIEVLTENDTLDGGDVVPGFSVREIFD